MLTRHEGHGHEYGWVPNTMAMTRAMRTQVSKPGEVLRIQGEGLPALDGNRFGALEVLLHTHAPVHNVLGTNPCMCMCTWCIASSEPVQVHLASTYCLPSSAGASERHVPRPPVSRGGAMGARSAVGRADWCCSQGVAKCLQAGPYTGSSDQE